MKRTRTLAEKPLSVEEARRLRGSGWEGDLAQMRAQRQVRKLRGKLRWTGLINKMRRDR